ncbi:hypothetical protein F8S09_15500 [Deinococcus sp. SDU3-2]|uniref:Uncharacterized protein n=1 Tax=Deinococcus terrestris TaxID=2651870 RepID=A0A7X1NZ73_9DEIO|nr:hypothetical protein [Deinococcus terrestris]MPY68061.1 hypothetical protein [Deinococcus terrestris]
MQWAVELHALSLQAEPPHRELARLAARFDQAHAKALALELPLFREFRVEVGGMCYVLALTRDGLEYTVLSR